MLYHSSSSCLRDNGGNLLLTLLSKTDRIGSMIFKVSDCASQRNVEVHLHAPESKTEHFWLCVWGQIVLKNCIIVRKHLDHRMHLTT